MWALLPRMSRISWHNYLVGLEFGLILRCHTNDDVQSLCCVKPSVLFAATVEPLPDVK